MAISGHRKSIALFITLGAILVAVIVTLNIGLIVWSWRTGVMLVLGALFCGLLIAGVVLNTIFLVREIRRNEQHDQFINAVTHELKTPVSSIRLYLETLLTREMDDKKRREFYGVMLADSDRLTHTIDQVLRAGQAKTWRKHHNRDVLNLGELATECVSLARLRHHLPEDAVRCECEHASVRGDADELKAAVSNLLDNAIKYSKSQVRVTVVVAAVDDKNVAVRVRDDGVGISPPELKRIFRRFYRIPGLVSTRVKGTGLGLFIVLSTAKRHGGKAYAESEGLGRGSTFTLQLPSAGGA
jgi:two-component system sensor histidine kinase SenX3